MIRLLAIPVVILALLGASIVWSGGGGVQRRADFTYTDRGDIFTLDLNQISYMQDFRVMYAIREGLYVPNHKTMRPEPAGAVSHTVSDDKRIWTFKLRPEARWSNGDPVTAHDYLFSFRRMLEESGEYTYLFYCLQGAEAYEKAYAKNEPTDIKSVGMEAVDDLTLKLTLKNPLTYMLELLAFPVFYPRNERSMEPFKVPQPNGRVTYRAEYTRPASSEGAAGVVTNGAFNLKQWDFKRRLVLERSETYWDRANVKVERIENAINEVVLSKFLSYESGAVDWLSDVPGDLAAELRAKGRTDLRSSPAFGTVFLTVLCKPQLPPLLGGAKNPLADVRVRQALAMSIDKQFICDHITRLGELPARTYLPPDGTLADFRWRPGPFDTSRSPEQPYDFKEIQNLLVKDLAGPGPGLPRDIEQAKRLLAEAGYPGGRGFPPLPILYNSDNQMRGKICQSLKSQWKAALNIDVVVQTVEGKIFKERVSKKDYAIAVAAWFGDYPDASTFTDKYYSTSLQNDSAYEEPAYDELLQQAQREPDAAKRGQLLTAAEHKLDTEVPIIPLYHYVIAYLSRDGVKNVDPNPRGIQVFKHVYVEK